MITAKSGSYIRFILILVIASLASRSSFSQNFERSNAKVTTKVLKIRHLPSMTANIIGRLEQGEVVEVIKKSNDKTTIDNINDYWYKISLKKSKKSGAGWVFGGYLTFELNIRKDSIWRQIELANAFPYLPYNDIASIQVVAGGKIYLGITSLKLAISANEGKKWLTKIPQALGVKIGGIDEIIINASDLWLLSRKASQQSAGLWRSTDNGESWTHYTKNEGLTGNIINDIKIAHNRIWTAAANGLSYSKDNGKNWQHFESGLFSKKTILSLLPAGNQEIYLGSANGLYKLAFADSFFGKKWQDTCIAEIKFLEK